jgi:hypothetical protein
MSLEAYLTLIFSLVLLVGTFYFLFGRKKEKQEVLKSFDSILFLVMMPKYETKKEEAGRKDEKVLIGQMEQIYTNFLDLSGSPKITFEMASRLGGTDISFYVAVPKLLAGAFEKYVQGVYPGALIEKVPQDYTIFEPSGFTAASHLRLKETSFLPISTYKNLEKDPLSSLTNALSKIAEDEGAAIQVIIRPFARQKKWKKIGLKALSKMKEGKHFSDSIREASRSWLSEFLADFWDLMVGAKTKEKKQERWEEVKAKGPAVGEDTIKAIQSKIQKSVFEVNVRLVASAQNQARADEILSHLESAFGQFSLLSFNGFEESKAQKGTLQKLAFDFSYRNFNPGRAMILNLEELASIYHFPFASTETPYLKTAKSSAAPPPADLPEKGLNLIGKVLYRGEQKDVYFASRNDRRRHFYLIGQTGTGKTSLLREMIRQDILNGEGVGVIDPHGELVNDILAQMPKERVEDVVLFEPFDTERPMGLNMLEYDTPEQKDFAVQEMISIFYKLFPPEIIGPMFEHYMRNAMLAIMADKANPGTLVEIPRMFTDNDFLSERLSRVSDPIVRNFWLKEWQQTTGSTRSDMLGYVVSKVGRFIENEMMRNIIGQSRSGFDLSEIMDNKKIFLANLSKGLTGEVNSSLLGLILVSKMQMAAMRRARISEEERKDFYLYIDEFQNFTTDSIATILSEARKYRLNLIIAHQYMPQLKPEIRNAVLGNVGSMGAFRIGAEDAELLEKQFSPEFTRFDLINLDNFNLIIKMMVENKISSAFKMLINRPLEGNAKLVQPIREISRLKYGKMKDIVEFEISRRSKLT